MFFKMLEPFDKDKKINETEFKKVFKILYESEVNTEYTLKKSYFPEGIYPSAISNVIIMEGDGLNNMLVQWLAKVIIDVNTEFVDFNKILPPEYEALWPRNQFQAQTAAALSKTQMKTFFQNYSLISVCRLQNR